MNRAILDITNFIFMNDTPQKSDVILVPGTSHAEITEKAAQLYHQGYANYVLPSGKFSSNLGRFACESVTNPRYTGEYATDFEYCKYILMVNGVPESAILREDQATNTMENAIFSAQVLNEMGIDVKRAILCCQAFHARRSFMSYSCHFPNIELLVVPTETQGITANGWYKNEKSYKKVLKELAKCGVYFSEQIKKFSSPGEV